MFKGMDTRSKLGVGFVLLVAAVALLIALDHFVLRPREPIYAFTDREALEQELEHIIVATSDVGAWDRKRTIQRTRLVVSAKFASRSAGLQSAEILTKALEKNAWRAYPPVSPQAVATLCKGRYRAEIEPMDSMGHLVSLDFLVKEFERDATCASKAK